MPRLRTAACVVVLTLAGLAGCVTTARYRGGGHEVDARAVTTATHDDGWLRAAPTPTVRQRGESDCGLAALAMVARRWGLEPSLGELAREAPPSKKGTRLAVLRTAARKRGLDAYAIQATPADLRHELALGRPVIVGLLRPYTHKLALRHYEVVVAMEPTTGTVITADPATGRWMERSADDLDREWKPAGYPALVVLSRR